MKHHVTCAICGKQSYIFVGNGAERKVGWFYFGKINVNDCQTSEYVFKLTDQSKGFDLDNLVRVTNPCYDENVKPKKVEYWECPKCAKLNETSPMEVTDS